MKFKIEREVFEKFPNIFIAIPVIRDFSNHWNSENEKLVSMFKEASQKDFLERFKSKEDIENNEYIKVYFEAFRKFGANPKKVKPTHFALASRVIEGGNLPRINPIVDLYNSFSINYITPFGGEDLSTVYGDFVLKLAKGDEHWLGIGEEKGKSPKQGDLIWEDDYDVSTLSLNWRQCERTKLTEDSQDGYFIMDGFKGINEKNIIKAANEFVAFITSHFGGEGEVIVLDKEHEFVEVDYKTRDIEGVVRPKVGNSSKEKSSKSNEGKKDKQFIYEADCIESEIQNQLYISLNKSLEAHLIDVSPVKDKKYGDYTSTVAMRVAGKLGKSPIEVAKGIAGKLGGIVVKAESVMPGFVNMYVNKNSIKGQLLSVDESWGKNQTGDGKKVMIEFGQPNTHKELTMGHIKSGITGLSLTRLFEYSGYEVIKANYFGDVGLMIAKALWGVIMKVSPESKIFELGDKDMEMVKDYLDEIKEKEGIKKVAKFFSDCYVFGNLSMDKDKEVEEEVRKINKLLYSKENDRINELYQYTRDLSIQYQDHVFAELGVVYDRQYPESENMEKGIKLVKENIGKVFKEDKGAVIFDAEEYGLKKFAFITSDGAPTYGAKDLGLAFKKFEEYPDLYLSIITTSVEQVDYFKNMIKALELIDPKFKGRYTHIGFGWLLFEGKKTSARMGKSFSYEDMLNELIAVSKERIKDKEEFSEEDTNSIAKKVAIAALKFGILSHEFHKDVNYNPDTFLNMSGYSGPYILYTYARANSILKKAGEYSKELKGSVLESPEEQAIIKKLIEFPKVVLSAQTNFASHLICTYVFELANLFNNFYSKYQVLNADRAEEKEARLVLVEAVTTVLKSGLNLLGIESIDKM